MRPYFLLHPGQGLPGARLVDTPAVRVRGLPAHRGQGVGGKQAVRTEPGQVQAERVARELGGVVGGRVHRRGQALGTELYAGEAERTGKGEQVPARPAVGRTPAEVALGVRREGCIVDAEQQPAHAEQLQGLAHGRRRGNATGEVTAAHEATAPGSRSRSSSPWSGMDSQSGRLFSS